MVDYSDPHGGLPPTIPPPEWVDNATCYSPKLVDNPLALLNEPIREGDDESGVTRLAQKWT